MAAGNCHSNLSELKLFFYVLVIGSILLVLLFLQNLYTDFFTVCDYLYWWVHAVCVCVRAHALQIARDSVHL